MQERNPLEGAALGADAQFGARPEVGPRQARVQEIDFRRPTKFPRDLVRRLEHAHESFCRTASSGLSAELRASLELAVAGSEQLPYGTAMAETDQDALLAVLNVKPLDTEVAMLIEMPLALRLVDRLLGGGGKPRDVISDSLTDLEVVIVKRAVQSLVEPLSATWLDLADVHFEIASMQTSPMTFQLVPPCEPVLMLHLEARLDGLVSPIVLCMPYRSVEPIVEQARAPPLRGPDRRSRRRRQGARGDQRHRRGAARGGRRRGPEGVRGAGAGVGDVIRLRRPADKGVVVYAGDVPTYVGTPGRNGNARAVQVRGAWERGR